MTADDRRLPPAERRAKLAATMPDLVAPDHPLYRVERFSVDHAAVYLCVGRERVYADVASGALGCRKDSSRRYRFSQADLDAWREARRIDARPGGKVRLPSARAPLAAVEPLRLPAKRRFS